MAKLPLPCRKIFVCALRLFFPLVFPLSRLFSQPAFAKFRRLFIRKVLAAFHLCAAKPLCLPRPFFMRRVLSSKPMPPCFPFSLIGLSQAYPSFKPCRVPAPAPPFFIVIISLALRPFGALRLFRANVFLPVCLAHALPPPLSAPLRRAVSPRFPNPARIFYTFLMQSPLACFMIELEFTLWRRLF